MTRDDLPTCSELILPTVRAVAALGGSARAREITSQVTSDIDATDEMLSLMYDTRKKSVLVDRMDCARSYAALGGLLDRPQRGVYMLTPAGREVLAMPDDEASATVHRIDREVRATRRRSKGRRDPTSETGVDVQEEGEGDHAHTSDSGSTTWQDDLLGRLHRLTPEGFEAFVLYLLRLYGMELTRVENGADRGQADAVNPFVSAATGSRVALQAIRYEPGKTHGTEVVALFQWDPSAAGAERAVLVTLARFSPAAKKAATAATPTVNLIDGQRLCELVAVQGVGLETVTRVVESFFDRFDHGRGHDDGGGPQ